MEMHTYGASGFASIDGRTEIWFDNEDEPAVATDYLTHTGAAKDDDYHHQGFLAQARGFIDAVQAGEPPHNSISDAVKTMELVEHIYAASE